MPGTHKSQKAISVTLYANRSAIQSETLIQTKPPKAKKTPITDQCRNGVGGAFDCIPTTIKPKIKRIAIAPK